jgi:hypothetical protein
MTEEEIKGRIILPYLADLGFDPAEVSLEKTFSIRLGRNTHQVSSDDDGYAVSGRLDLLCRKSSQNLFVIEVKRDGIKITQEDIEQGISYARLVDNIAPFVIVSNGEKTVVVDSITRGELDGSKISGQSSFWQNGCELATDEDLRIRHEALSRFVGYSDKNLKVFCNGQVAARMSTIAGSASGKEAKYVPSLYTERASLESAYEMFLAQSDRSVFAVVGESGVGKTNSLCAMCQQALEKHFPLFYAAGLLGSSLFDAIGRDFNLFFSGAHSSPENLLRTIGGIAGKRNRTVIIFIDGIDECDNRELRYEIGEIALALRSVANVKMCLSCKTESWRYFLRLGAGSPSYLTQAVYPALTEEMTPSKDNHGPGFVLPSFNDNELEAALEKYQTAFGLKGVISKAVKNELHVGLMLRLFSQRYRDQIAPSTVEDRELMKSYLISNAGRISDLSEDAVLRIVSEFGRILIEQQAEYPNRMPGGSLELLRKRLGLTVMQDLPEGLFLYNLLVRQPEQEPDGLAFYYSQLRDYVICFSSYNLDHLASDQFRETVALFYEGSVGFSAINYYWKYASDEQKMIVDGVKAKLLSSFAEEYEELLSRNFPQMRTAFDPYSEGQIGVATPSKSRSPVNWFALVPTKSMDPNGRVIRVDDPGPRLDNLFAEYGASLIHGSDEIILEGDTTTAAKAYLLGQLPKIIEAGRLNESQSHELVVEKLVNVLYWYRDELGYPRRSSSNFYPRYEELYPIDLRDALARTRFFFAKRHYQEEQRKGLIASGNIVSSNGGTSFSYSNDDFNWDLIRRQAEEAVLQGALIPMPNVSGNFPPFVWLQATLEELIKNGLVAIEDHHLPTADIPPPNVDAEVRRRRGKENWIPAIVAAHFTEEQMRRYITSFLITAEKSLCDVVDVCFPHMKNDLNFYRSAPHEYIVAYRHEDPDSFNLTYGWRRSRSGFSEVHFVEDDFGSAFLSKHGVDSVCHSSVADVLWISSSDARQTFKGLDTTKVDESCVIRQWVYRVIESDIKDLLQSKRIGNRHGLGTSIPG